MGLDDSLKQLKFDQRMEEWNLRHGVLKKDEQKKYLESLEDSSSNIEYLNVYETSLQKAEFDNGGLPNERPVSSSYLTSESEYGQH